MVMMVVMIVMMMAVLVHLDKDFFHLIFNEIKHLNSKNVWKDNFIYHKVLVAQNPLLVRARIYNRK
jgi:hypothetical protein